MDSVVFSTATGEITLTLPSSPKQGQIYFIRKVGSGNVKLTRGNTQHRICTNSNSQNNTEITLDWGKLWIILGSCEQYVDGQLVPILTQKQDI